MITLHWFLVRPSTKRFLNAEMVMIGMVIETRLNVLYEGISLGRSRNERKKPSFALA